MLSSLTASFLLLIKLLSCTRKLTNHKFVLSRTKFKFFECLCVLLGVFKGAVSLRLKDSLIDEENELLGVNLNESLLEVDMTSLLCARMLEAMALSK